MPLSPRFFGVTTLSPFFQVEGVGPVLDRLQAVGVNAVAVNTSVAAPGREGEGSYQPPSDGGTSPRLFDRPLWGKCGLWLRSAPGHRARSEFFAGSPYQPRPANDLSASAGPIIGEFIAAAKGRRMRVYVQTSAATPPGLADEDRPRLPDGCLPAYRMADTGSLASPAVRAWNRAWCRDIFAQYPEIDGIRPDWPEYPCYTLNEAFSDCGPHVENWANAHGFDFAAIRREVLAFWRYLHGSLRNDDLADFVEADGGRFALASLLTRFPGVAEFFRLKAALSSDLLADWRAAITEAAGPEKDLSANAFMTPYSFVTGLDFARVGDNCGSVSAKLYTMHWCQMVEFWGRELLDANPGLDEGLLVAALVHLMDLAEPGGGGRTLADYHYPEPDEAHPIPTETQARKLRQMVRAVGGRAQVYALVHGYGPLDDFSRRFALAAQSPVDGVWVNRYGYLSDEKLVAVGEEWKERD
ncbi:MAG: hypothetical protein HY328_00675 [Chloroflexi bacterium]|nr:hypothetical protein [Chloroflexota bacterium]